MARVPTLDAPRVAPEAAPNFRQQNTVSAERLSIRDRQLGQLGQAAEQTGGMLSNVHAQLVDQANALRVDDALNQAQERALRLQHGPDEGYTNLKGYDALKRDSGQPLPEEFTGKLDESLSEISAGLGNERQRAMFQQRANGLRTNFLGNAMAYTGEQAKVYGLSVREGTVSNAANALVLNFSDPTNVGVQVNRIRGAIEGGVDPNTGAFIPGSAQMAGKSATWAKEKADEAVSGAHSGAIQAAMEAGNVNGAMAYRQKYAEQMTASDMLKVDGILQKNYDTMRGATAARQVMTAPPVQASLNPTDFDRLRNVVLNIESGGRRFGADGKILEGPHVPGQGTAKGEMQVMDATFADPGYGVRGADKTIMTTGSEEQKAVERARVGNEYLSALLKHYNGDIAKATAAYNWGPGNVDKAVKETRENAGKGDDPNAWLATAPTQTQNYVASVQRKMGNPALSNPSRPTLEQLQGQAVTALGPNPSALAMRTAKDTVAADYETQTKAIKQRADETVTRAMQELDQNGGRFSDLSPALRSQLVQHAPDKVDELMNYGVRVAKGDDITNDAVYLRLATDEPYLKGLSDAQFYQLKTQLSQNDFQHFAKQRAASKQNTATDPGNLDSQAVSRTVNSRLASMGMDPSPKDGTADAQRIGAMRRVIDSSLMDAQRSTGKKFNDADVAKHVDDLFAKSVTFRKTFLGVDRGTGSAQVLGLKYGDIPSDQREQIEKAFKAQGIAEPTDGDVLYAYMAGQIDRQKPRAATPGSRASLLTKGQ